MARTGTDPQEVIAVRVPVSMAERIDAAARKLGKARAAYVRGLLAALHEESIPAATKRRPPCDS
jgi:hypothetical protein